MASAANFKLFDETGFTTWEFRVRLVLGQHNVLAFLEESAESVKNQVKFIKREIKARNIIVQ